MVNTILIAGSGSGVGKTTITTGLIAALRQRGVTIQPFKAGPDYIDPTYHTLAAGIPCRNIDTWMVPPERALSLFYQASQQTDLSLIEGVMGLFDGFSYDDEAGSSAQIAKLLGAPVLLVLDVGKMARSAAALAVGYTRFDPDLNIAGFILNRCGSVRHYEGVKRAVEQATERPVVGWLPKDAGLHIPERHLGLVPTDERGQLTDFIDHAVETITAHFDLNQIVAISDQSATSPNPLSSDNRRSETHKLQSPVKIAVAHDEAFSFYYADNLDLLREAGAEVIFFSPQTDTSLPADTSGLYLGGGFPELYAAQLAQNIQLHQAIRQANAANMPIYAECGGFMYLTEAIIDLDGRQHPMIGLVPGISRMQPRLMSLGYRIAQTETGNFLLPKGMTARGHEFHWSSWEGPTQAPNEHHGQQALSSQPAWYVQPRQANGSYQPNGYADGNLLGSYIHLHFAYDLQLAPNFVQACREWRSANAC